MAQHPWRQGAVVYQIYPRSFADAGASGTGNLRGIIEKLDYLAGTAESLGITAIWLSPIYTSPMADFGYDVANYVNIDPIFGNLDDFTVLVSEAHKRDLKVIVDFVPNHSSDEHPWFIESRASLDNPKRDWYVWHDPKDGGNPPNNWRSVFGGSAWELSEPTHQYYLHSFLSKQPNLNWDNSELRGAMKSVMRFWLDLGVDGFRVDAVDWLSRDPQFRDDPLDKKRPSDLPHTDYYALRHVNSRDGPYLFDRLSEMTNVLSEYPDRFMISEAHPETDDTIQGYLQYYRNVDPSLGAPFNLQGIYIPWSATDFRTFIDKFQAGLEPGYTPIYTVGNHDESRIASRIGTAAARTAAMMLLTLPGMAFIYYGEELGMQDVVLSESQVRDPYALLGKDRDPQRTPLPWDNSLHGGFTNGKPWLPLSSDYKKISVASQSSDRSSMLNLYKALLRIRTTSDILKSGDYQSFSGNDNVFCFERSLSENSLLVVLNFTDTPQQITSSKLCGTLLLSTYMDKKAEPIGKSVLLRPNEGLLVEATHD